jgi:C4-dicarboxylate transporter DctM subunit
MFDPFGLSLTLIILLAMFGLPIGESMICGTIAYLGLAHFDTSIAAETMLQGLYSGYTLLAIPLFILAADIMNIGTLADKLLRFSQALVGRFRGGLGHVNVVANLIFSGMSGSALADAVGIGRVIISMMVRDGKYTPSYAAAITAAAATIGPIIPPSIPMVLYALVSDTSIGYLFAAGLLPGLLMGLMLMLMHAWIARRRNFPRDEAIPLAQLPKITAQATPALLLPIILLGGIYGGVMTPTEAAAVAALYALLVSSLFYRSVSPKQLYTTLLDSARSTATIGILIAGSLAYNYVITREDIPNHIAAALQNYHFTQSSFLVFINLLFLALGCLIDAGAILVIVVPIFMPTVHTLGIDPVHFGVIAVVNTMIGLVTPPYGLLLFIVANMTKQPLTAVVKDLVPFIVALIAALAIITFAPDLVLLIPRRLGYQG